MRAIALAPDRRTAAQMAAGMPGEAKYKPALVLSEEERERISRDRRELQQERKNAQARFKRDPSKKSQASTPRPETPRMEGSDAVQSLMRGGLDKANVADVWGRPGQLLPNHRKTKKRGTMASRPITRGIHARIAIKPVV